MQFTVNLYKAVRIRFENVKADNPREAMEKADQSCDMPSLISEADRLMDEETCALGALVDFPDDPDNDRSVYVEGESARLYLADDREDKLTLMVGLLNEARAAWADGDMDKLGGILAGDVCRDAVESVLEGWKPIDEEAVAPYRAALSARRAAEHNQNRERG